MPTNLSTTVAKPKLVLAAAALILSLLLISTAPSAASAAGGGIGSSTPADSTESGKKKSGSNMTPSKYHRKWDKASARNKKWAHRVADCETGRDPNATALGGQYRGAFMFTRDAWRIAAATPGGDPIDYSYKTQAVVALSLKRELGTDPWPVCG